MGALAQQASRKRSAVVSMRQLYAPERILRDEKLKQDQTPQWSRVVSRRRRDRDYQHRRILLAGDMIALYLALLIALLAGGDRARALEDSVWVLFTLPAWALLLNSYQLYKRPVQSLEPTHLDDLPRLFHAMLVGTLALWLYYRLIPPTQLILAEAAVFLLTAMALTVLLRRIARPLNEMRGNAERVCLVATEADALSIKRKIANHPEYGLELVAVIIDRSSDERDALSSETLLEALGPEIERRQIDFLLIRLDLPCLTEDTPEALMHLCFSHGVRFGAYPGPRSLLLPGAHLNNIEGIGILVHDVPVLSRSDRIMKRTVDVGLSLLLLILSIPLMIMIAGAIRFDSKGPILFRQPRVGKDGRLFRVNKFRTMVPDAEAMADELMKESVDPDWLDLDDDPRITRVGRFLRRTSLDEVPQLWNVFNGEMSLVGPRPLSVRDDEGLRGRQRNRLDLAPGVTGYWQVLGRTSIPFKEMVEIDYAYVTGWSLWLDLKIILRTVPVILSRRGAN